MRVRFGDHLLDLERRELRRGAEALHLTSKAFELLALLVRERPRALSKGEIAAQLWRDVAVSEGSLSVLVAEVRRVLGDNARAPLYLRTVHGYGLAFCGRADPAPTSQTAPGLCRIVVWGLQEFQIGEGETVIGRDPTCEVMIDLASLSRRHARLQVAPGRAILEDLKSKNGSLVNGERVSGPRPLADGDEIRLGSAVLSFHWRALPQIADTMTSPAGKAS